MTTNEKVFSLSSVRLKERFQISDAPAWLRLRISYVPRLLLLLLLTLPAAVQAQYLYETNGGKIRISSYTGSVGAMTIPSTINGLPVTSVMESAFSSGTSVTSVTIPNTVNDLAGGSVFYSCTNLAAITVDALNPFYSSVDGVLFNKSQTTLIKCPGGKAGSYTIPNSVTSIGSWGFYGCSRLTSITIPNSVTSIGSFYGCSSLTSVTIPSSVTNIGSAAFAGCTNLAAITVDALNSVYNSMDGVLFNKSRSTLIQYPGGKAGSYTIPNSVTNIGSAAFAGCTSLAAITVDALNPFYSSVDGVLFNKSQTTLILYPGGKAGSYTIPNSVTNIGSYAFSGCISLTNVTIPNSVTNIGSYAFSGCISLTNVTIPNSVTSIGNDVFSGCTSLTNVTIPNSVTSIGYGAFVGCSSLTSITIPNSVTSIGSFYGCSSLTSVTIPSSVTNIIRSSAFEGCTSLAAITVDALNPFYSSVDGVLFNKSQTTLILYPGGKAGSYTIPDSVTSFWSAFDGGGKLTSVAIGIGVTNINSFAFGRCTSLTEINVNAANPFYSSVDGVLFDKSQATLLEYPVNKSDGSYTIADSVTTIGSYAFQERNRLTSIKIPNSVTNIGYWAFFRCTRLTSVAIGIGVTNIRYDAFSGCTSLTSITIPNSVTSIGNDAFSGCTSLTSITIGNSVTNNGSYAFSGCTSLTSVTIPNTVASIGSWGFYGCTSLTNITIPDSIPSIGDGAFSGCTSLTSITIPNSVTSIGNDAFSGCSSLTSATIGNSVTNIGTNAFYDCTSLTSITIPDSVTSIGSQAFSYCASLTSVYFKGNAPSVGSSSFTGNDKATVYYLPGTTGWGPTFGGRPTALWNPQAQTSDASFGVRTNRFGFSIIGTSGLVIVVEACTNLVNPTWCPLETNTLTGDSSYFRDPEWTNYPARFYRLRSP